MVKQQINIQVDKELYLKFKSNCVLLGVNVGEQITKLMTGYNKEFEGKERWKENGIKH